MAEVVSTGVSHMCDNSTVSVKLIIILLKLSWSLQATSFCWRYVEMVVCQCVNS